VDSLAWRAFVHEHLGNCSRSARRLGPLAYRAVVEYRSTPNVKFLSQPRPEKAAMFHASTNADFTLFVRPEFRAGLSFTQEIQAHAILVWTVAAETITGKRIAGNSRKFAGLPVDLHGVVVNVVDGRTSNFRTGDVSMDDNGNISNTMGMIVVRCNSTQDLEADQTFVFSGSSQGPSRERTQGAAR
jgi:hypothetical protein